MGKRKDKFKQGKWDQECQEWKGQVWCYSGWERHGSGVLCDPMLVQVGGMSTLKNKHKIVNKNLVSEVNIYLEREKFTRNYYHVGVIGP